MNYWKRGGGKPDANQKEIVDALRKSGASVAITSLVGFGFPDLVVGVDGKNLLIEVKTQAGNIPEKEKTFFRDWKGNVVLVRSVEAALEALRKFRSKENEKD